MCFSFSGGGFLPKHPAVVTTFQLLRSLAQLPMFHPPQPVAWAAFVWLPLPGTEFFSTFVVRLKNPLLSIFFVLCVGI